MQKKWSMFALLLILGIVLAACNGETDEDGNLDDLEEELAVLEVDLQVNESVEVGETLEMLSEVTFGDEVVTDAAEVDYEIWEKGERDDATFIDADNHEDGTYTAETAFDDDGIYHVQVHVTARDMHTMPEQEVTVGEGGDYSHVDEDEDHDHGDMHPDHDEDHDHEHGFHMEGFDMHFTELESVTAGEEAKIEINITLDEAALEDVDVRYEIWKENEEDNTDWVEATESNPGSYAADYVFEGTETYHIQVHVEDDEDLHEHLGYEVHVKE